MLPIAIVVITRVYYNVTIVLVEVLYVGTVVQSL